MTGHLFRRIGLFGRTYAIMLASVLFAEGLIFVLTLVTPPPNFYVPYAAVAQAMRGQATERKFNLVAGQAAQPRLPPSDQTRDPAARHAQTQFQQALQATFGPAATDVRVAFTAHPPGHVVFGPDPFAETSHTPMFVVGDFTVEWRGPDGAWHSVSTGGAESRDGWLRVLVLLLVTLAAVIPFAYLLALVMTKPIKRFADAAERVGRDPKAPHVPVDGPAEIRVASEAMNRMQERLSRYVEDRTSLISAVAHDLRTPLMRMSFQIEEVDDATRQKLAAQIHEMREMIDVALSYFRDERERRRYERTDLVSIIEAICDNAREAGEAVTFARDGQAVVLGDTLGLRSVFENLIGNAVKYGRTAAVTVSQKDQHALVTIADRGEGIPPELLEKVFDPFFRVEGSRSRTTGGTGLGLTIVRSTVVAHGGTVWLENSQGSGLTAHVRLPLWR